MKRTAIGGAIAIVLIACCAETGRAQTTAWPAAPASGAVIVPPGHKFIMQLETPLHTRTTRKGNRVELRTAADVVVDNQVLIPNRSLIRGTVTKARRAGRLFGRAEIQLRFEEVRLTDGTALPLKATITRVGFDLVDPAGGQDPKRRLLRLF